MKIAELEGAELDFWVAKAEGWKFNWSKHNYYVITGPNGEREVCWEGWSEFDPATGEKNKVPAPSTCMISIGYIPSYDWDQGGPIIEREKIGVLKSAAKGEEWIAWIGTWRKAAEDGETFEGPTPLVAAMRAFIASKYGETVNDI